MTKTSRYNIKKKKMYPQHIYNNIIVSIVLLIELTLFWETLRSLEKTLL